MEDGRIAVIDDEPFITEIYKLMFKDQYCVEAFDSAEHALTALTKDGAYDAIICDLRMPKIDGVKFMSTLRQIGLEIPIILATGHVDVESAIEAVTNGAFAIVQKPIDASELTVLLERAVTFSRLKKQNNKLLDIFEQLIDPVNTPEQVSAFLKTVRPFVERQISEKKRLGELSKSLRQAS